MSEELLSSLFDFGALGIFAGFLVWQHLGMQKRLDRLIEDFQQETKGISDAFDARAELIREKYEAVLATQRKEHRAEREKLSDQVSLLQRDLLARERESVMNFKLGRDA
mgnify:CR=1 FL=1